MPRLLGTESEEQNSTARFHPNAGGPTLVYLPGIHGDWTLFTSFRGLAAERFEILEFTYPRRTDWNLAEYAEAVIREIGARELLSVWLLAESFSSQVAWAMCGLAAENILPFRIAGIVLAGGFVRYPGVWIVRATEVLFKIAPHSSWRLAFRIYAQFGALRHRAAPETRDALADFVARRTPRDLAAIRHRLELIAGNDPRLIAKEVNCPVFMLAGGIDPVVPAFPVLRWLKANCPGFAGHRIIWPADHNVLGTQPKQALDQISSWVGRGEIAGLPPEVKVPRVAPLL